MTDTTTHEATLVGETYALALAIDDTSTIPELVTAVAQGEVLRSLVKRLVDERRVELRDRLEALAREAGLSPTAKVEGVARATVTEPDPKPRITDRRAFAEYLHTEVGHGAVEVDALEVRDEQAAARAVRTLATVVLDGDAVTIEFAVMELLRHVMHTTDYLLPADVLDSVTKDPRFDVVAGGIVDAHTGELVPGVTCSRATPTLQVRIEPEARQRATERLSEALGVHQVEGGA